MTPTASSSPQSMPCEITNPTSPLVSLPQPPPRNSRPPTLPVPVSASLPVNVKSSNCSPRANPTRKLPLSSASVLTLQKHTAPTSCSSSIFTPSPNSSTTPSVTTSSKRDSLPQGIPLPIAPPYYTLQPVGGPAGRFCTRGFVSKSVVTTAFVVAKRRDRGDQFNSANALEKALADQSSIDRAARRSVYS